MPLTLDQFRRALARPGQLPADVAEEVLASFSHWVQNAHRGVTLEKAMGGSGPSGCDPWHIKLAIERRDQALRELAAVLCPNGAMVKKANDVRLALHQYRPTWNRRDQFRDAPVTDDARARWLFAAFAEAAAAGTELPDSPGHLRAVLSVQAIEQPCEPLQIKTRV